MSNFTYDPALIRDLAEELICSASPTPSAWDRKRMADIELYAEEYALYNLEEFEEHWDRYGNRSFDSLTNEQAHRLLVYVATWHSDADWELVSDDFSERAFFVFRDDVANNPETAIGGQQ